MKKRVIYGIISALIAVFMVFAVSGCSLLSARAVKSTSINSNGELIVTYSDGTTQNAGKVNGKDGADGADFDINSLYDRLVEDGYTGTFTDFLKEYLSVEVNEDDLEDEIQQMIRSCVSVVCQFSKPTSSVASGAGWFYSVDTVNGDAFVVTNAHVIYNTPSASRNVVYTFSESYLPDVINLYLYGSYGFDGSTTSDGTVIANQVIEAEVYGCSTQYDIAVLKVENSSVLKGNSFVKAVEFKSETDVKVGQRVVAIGNADGKGMAVTDGVISVDSESITLTDIVDPTSTFNIRVMRMNTEINHGNSGGGLFNSDGQLIGMTNAGDTSGEVDGFYYAIPSFTIENVIRNILSNCDGDKNLRAQRIIIGITTIACDSYPVFENGVVKTIQDIKVSEVSATSLVYGKMKAGDIIRKFSIHGKTYDVSRSFTVLELMLGAVEGDSATFYVERNGAQIEIPITFNNVSTTSV